METEELEDRDGHTLPRTALTVVLSWKHLTCAVPPNRGAVVCAGVDEVKEPSRIAAAGLPAAEAEVYRAKPVWKMEAQGHSTSSSGTSWKHVIIAFFCLKVSPSPNVEIHFHRARATTPTSPTLTQKASCTSLPDGWVPRSQRSRSSRDRLDISSLLQLIFTRCESAARPFGASSRHYCTTYSSSTTLQGDLPLYTWGGLLRTRMNSGRSTRCWQ